MKYQKANSEKISIFSKMSALAKQHQAINLGQGFPNFEPAEELKKLVNKYLHKSYNQYAPMAGQPELRNALLKLILRGKRFGFSLESIRQWLELYDLGDSQVTQLTTWLEHAQMQMETLREQRDELQDAMTELQDLINYVERDLEHRGASEAAQ